MPLSRRIAPSLDFQCPVASFAYPLLRLVQKKPGVGPCVISFGEHADGQAVFAGKYIQLAPPGFALAEQGKVFPRKARPDSNRSFFPAYDCVRKGIGVHADAERTKAGFGHMPRCSRFEV